MVNVLRESKIEARARHISLLKQKINLLQIQNAPTQRLSHFAIKRKLLTQVAQTDSCYDLQSKKQLKIKKLNKILQKQKDSFVIKNKQIKRRFEELEIKKNERQNKFFWSSRQKYYILDKKQRLNIKQNTLEKNQKINWKRIINRSEIINTNMIRKRIKNFQNSSKIIQSTLNRLYNQENSLINAVLKQFSLQGQIY